MPLTGLSQAARKSGTSPATEKGSRGSYPEMACSSSAESRTVRVRGPTCASVGVADAGKTGTRPNWALIPKRLVIDAGIRSEPPPSVPSASALTPAATLAAAPALEPPGVRVRSQGLRVMPVNGESPTALQPNSLVVVLPMMQPPAALIRSAAGASTWARLPARVREPKEQGSPATVMRSLTDTGRPCRSPSGAPSMTACSACLAAARASSGVRAANALSLGSVSSIRSSARCTTSTGETSLRAMAARVSSADMKSSSCFIACPSQMAPRARSSVALACALHRVRRCRIVLR